MTPGRGETARYFEDRLLAAREPGGFWKGRLSSSALATATALIALSLSGTKDEGPLTRAATWILQSTNSDGGYGDTPVSKSNMSTTLLVRAALLLRGGAPRDIDDWIEKRAGGTDSDKIISALEKRYGTDRTFAVPILTASLLTGAIPASGWARILPLPFELSVLPHFFFRWIGLPVVSYALPALIAVGIVGFLHAPPRNVFARALRQILLRPALRKLERLQPSSGGFLEAVPLTSFVVMSLSGAGFRDHPVVRNGVSFLLKLQRPDGSWPIDTNLSTWVTTLSINSLAGSNSHLRDDEKKNLKDWLLRQQAKTRHPYTDSPPGGWAWTPEPGGVPDADDTAGALTALRNLGMEDDDVVNAVRSGVRWLLGIQNRNGGFPTFCRGWGKLPFDRSCPDITAHCLSAFLVWKGRLGKKLEKDLVRATRSGIRYLESVQNADGSWTPLWFGNEFHPLEENRMYGTARVILLTVEIGAASQSFSSSIERGLAWLILAQNTDGGFGGGPGIPSTIEETGLAIAALSGGRMVRGLKDVVEEALGKGCEFLGGKAASEVGASPIGLYFARLAYYEELYPLIFAVGGLKCLFTTQPET